MTYSASLATLAALADKISTLDGLAPCGAARPISQAAHDLIIGILGADARIVYGPEDSEALEAAA